MTVSEFEKASNSLQYNTIMLNSFLSALSFAQALTWTEFVDLSIHAILPVETSGVLSAFCVALLTTGISIVLAAFSSKVVRKISSIIPEIELKVEKIGR